MLCFRPSPIKRSSRSRTCGCSRSFRRATRRSPNRSNQQTATAEDSARHQQLANRPEASARSRARECDRRLCDAHGCGLFFRFDGEVLRLEIAHNWRARTALAAVPRGSFRWRCRTMSTSGALHIGRPMSMSAISRRSCSRAERRKFAGNEPFSRCRCSRKDRGWRHYVSIGRKCDRSPTARSSSSRPSPIRRSIAIENVRLFNEIQDKSRAARSRQPPQVRIPRRHVARAAHAAERDHRFLGGAAGAHVRRDQREAGRVSGGHPRLRRASAVPDQRHPRSLEDRSRAHGSRAVQLQRRHGARQCFDAHPRARHTPRHHARDGMR